MTILGKHTIVETRDLMRTIQFRADKNDEVFKSIRPNNSPEYMDLKVDWFNWLNQWKQARDTVADDLVMLSIGQPLVPADVITSEPQYQKIEKGAQVDNGKKHDKTDMMQLMIRTEQLSGTTFDEKNAPAPTNFDPDLIAFKKVDQAIKTGEAAAKEAKANVASAAKSNVGLIIGAGIAVFLAGGIVAKVYLPRF